MIPPYRRPDLPAGTPIDLKDVPPAKVRRHRSYTYWLGSSARGRADFGPRFGPNRQVLPGGMEVAPTTMHGATRQITAYDVAGAGYSAFSATVRINPGYAKPSLAGRHLVKVNFEVRADGAIVAQSGLMAAADAPRLIAGKIPAGAKEVMLITRYERPDRTNLGRQVYVQWRKPRFYRGE